MQSKRIIQCLIILIVASLTFAAINAVESNDVHHSDSSNTNNQLNVNESGEVNPIVHSASQTHTCSPEYITAVYV